MVVFLTALIVLLHILLATSFRGFSPLKFHTNDSICGTFIYSLFKALDDIFNMESVVSFISEKLCSAIFSYWNSHYWDDRLPSSTI